jgi:hypothetical protein
LQEEEAIVTIISALNSLSIQKMIVRIKAVKKEKNMAGETITITIIPIITAITISSGMTKVIKLITSEATTTPAVTSSTKKRVSSILTTTNLVTKMTTKKMTRTVTQEITPRRRTITRAKTTKTILVTNLTINKIKTISAGLSTASLTNISGKVMSITLKRTSLTSLTVTLIRWRLKKASNPANISKENSFRFLATAVK